MTTYQREEWELEKELAERFDPLERQDSDHIKAAESILWVVGGAMAIGSAVYLALEIGSNCVH